VPDWIPHRGVSFGKVEWPYRAAEDDVVDVMEAVAAGSIDKQTLSEWLQAMADFPG
jgi:hypothetical protein